MSMHRHDSICESTSYYHRRFPGNCQLGFEKYRNFSCFLIFLSFSWLFFAGIRSYSSSSTDFTNWKQFIILLRNNIEVLFYDSINQRDRQKFPTTRFRYCIEASGFLDAWWCTSSAQSLFSQVITPMPLGNP